MMLPETRPVSRRYPSAGSIGPWGHMSLDGMETHGDQAMDAVTTEEDPGRETIQVRIPVAESFLQILRSVVGRASRIAGFSYDGIEDFSLAVDEAAVLLMETNPRTLMLTLTRVNGIDRLLAEVSATEPTKSPALWGPDSDLRWEVLGALCDEVWWVDGKTAIGLAQAAR